MNGIRFSWDERKAAQNARKHGVSFEEAMTVFFDENAPEFFAPDYSADEDRQRTSPRDIPEKNHEKRV